MDCNCKCLNACSKYFSMEFGCGQCLAAAIESHQCSLLFDLLMRPVAYRDIFWAPMPRTWKCSYNYKCIIDRITDDFDVTRIGQSDCGHETFDVELTSPIPSLAISNRILASLPILARWHSSHTFPAVQMLRDSRKFDFSEPQFYHQPDFFSYGSSDCLTRFNAPYPWIRLHFDMDCSAVCWPSDSNAYYYQHLNRSMYVFEHNIVYGKAFFREGCWKMKRINDTIYEAFEPFFEYVLSGDKNDIGPRDFIYSTCEAIKSGIDPNKLLCSQRYNWLICSSQFKQKHFFLLSLICSLCERVFFEKEEFYELIALLLSNGLSFFYGEETKSCLNHQVDCSLSNIYHSDLEFASELLALGYGRRELHPADIQILDENLEASGRKQATENFDILLEECSWHRDKLIEFQSLLNHFDSGPLTLQQLSRIAVRRAVGGYDFARRIRVLETRLPPPLLEYVCDPMKSFNRLMV